MRINGGEVAVVLLSSVEFWFGAAMLCILQYEKFLSIDGSNPALPSWVSTLASLRTRDFVSRRAFVSVCILYLCSTIILYLVLCMIAPDIIAGWGRISGDPNPGELASSVPYPLYIAAALAGLGQPSVPLTSSIAKAHKDIFHHIIGVPGRIAEVANYYSNQILARAQSAESADSERERLRIEIKKLTSPAFYQEIEGFSDTIFYQNKILDILTDDDNMLTPGADTSIGKLRDTISKLVFVAALATTREGGLQALSSLANALNVRPFPIPPPVSPGIAYTLVLSLLLCVILWFVLPLLSPFVKQILLPPGRNWPSDTEAASGYILWNVVPILVSVAILLFIAPAQIRGSRGFTENLNRNAIFLISIVVLVVISDYAQVFYDYSVYSGNYNGSSYLFVMKWFPYNLLHGVIPATVCILIISYVARCNSSDGNGSVRVQKIRTYAEIVIFVGLIATFYSVSRLLFLYNDSVSVARGTLAEMRDKIELDFVVLVAILNIAAAATGFSAAIVVLSSRLGALSGHSDPYPQNGTAQGQTVTPNPNAT